MLLQINNQHSLKKYDNWYKIEPNQKDEGLKMVKYKTTYTLNGTQDDVFGNLQQELQDAPPKVAMHATMLTEDS